MEIDAIIEVPQNSKVKYEFCTETQKIKTAIANSNKNEK